MHASNSRSTFYWPRIPRGPEIFRTPLDHSELHPHGINYTEPLKVFYIALHRRTWNPFSVERLHRYIADVSHLVHIPRGYPEATRQTAEKAACALRGPVPPIKYEKMWWGRGKAKIFKEGEEIALVHNLLAYPHRRMVIRHLNQYTGKEEDTVLRTRLTSSSAFEWEQDGFKYKWAWSGVLYKLTLEGEIWAVAGKMYMHARNRPRVLIFNAREVDEVLAVMSASRMDRFMRRTGKSIGWVYVGRDGPM